MLLEFVVPGLVIVFFGVSAVLVGLAAWAGLVASLPASLLLWGVTSCGFVFGVRRSLRRLSPGRTERGSIDEDLDAFGALVEVLEPIGPDIVGRIRFRGTTWLARTVEEQLGAGARARIVTREELVWLVERDNETPALPPG